MHNKKRKEHMDSQNNKRKTKKGEHSLLEKRDVGRAHEVQNPISNIFSQGWIGDQDIRLRLQGL